MILITIMLKRDPRLSLLTGFHTCKIQINFFFLFVTDITLSERSIWQRREANTTTTRLLVEAFKLFFLQTLTSLIGH